MRMAVPTAETWEQPFGFLWGVTDSKRLWMWGCRHRPCSQGGQVEGYSVRFPASPVLDKLPGPPILAPHQRLEVPIFGNMDTKELTCGIVETHGD